MTASERGNRNRCSARTGGASMKLRMPASASGISTSRAKYMIATTITPISNAFSVDDVEFTFPPNGAALELAVNI